MDELEKMVASLDAEFDQLQARVEEKQKEFDVIDKQLTSLKHVRDWMGKALRALGDLKEAKNAVALNIVPYDPEPPL